MSETSGQEPSISVAIDASVARVTISNPGKRNAFTWGMYDQLLQIAEELRDSASLSAVVFRGNPEDGFAAGTDIRQFVDFTSATDGIEYERRVGRILQTVASIPVMTIAAIERSAVGAGLALAATCDVVVAERGARFGAPIVRTLGNCLPIGVVARLRSRLGVSRTVSMLLTARLVLAEELTSCGFVSTLTDPGDVHSAVDAILERVATAAPLTLRALKEMNRRLDDINGLPEDADLLGLCYGSADFREGVGAFLEQRLPHWSGS